MSALQPVLQFLLSIIRHHKLKLLIVPISALAFTLLIFPYDDLAELVTAQVAAGTHNQVYVQSERMGIRLIPSPGLTFEKVSIDTPNLPTLEAARLSFAPSIWSLLAFKLGFAVAAKGFLDGNVDFVIAPSGKSESGQTRQKLSLDIEGVDIGKALKLFDLPVELRGKTDSTSTLVVDPTFSEQPDGTIEMRIKELKLPASTVPTQMGPIAVPNLSWSQVVLKGRMSGGKFTIEEGTLGSGSDPFNGRVRGDIDLQFDNRSGQIVPNFGPYNLRVELNVAKAVEKDLALVTVMIDRFKAVTNSGSRYVVRIQGARTDAPPNITPLTSFQ